MARSMTVSPKYLAGLYCLCMHMRLLLQCQLPDKHSCHLITAALVGGTCYLVMQRASQVLSPRLCKAYNFLTRLEQQEWDSR